MTYSLFITGMHESLDRVDAVKYIKRASDALRAEDIETTVESTGDAAGLLDVLAADGYACLVPFVNEPWLESVTTVKDSILRANGIAAAINPDLSRLDRIHADRKLTAQGATPEQVFQANAPGEAAQDPQEPQEDEDEPRSLSYPRTAMAMLYAAGGDPVAAAQDCARMAKATDEAEFFAEVIRELIELFPHIIPELMDDGTVSEA